MELSIIIPECFAFYSEKFCAFSETLLRECPYPQLLHSSLNFFELFFSVQSIKSLLNLQTLKKLQYTFIIFFIT